MSQITIEQFSEWMTIYTKLRLPAKLDHGFVHAWRRKIQESECTLSELTMAVENLIADPRIGHPINDLPLILEHAREARDFMRPTRLPDLPPPAPRDSRWDEKMLEFGAITKREFEKRKKERNAARSTTTAT